MGNTPQPLIEPIVINWSLGFTKLEDTVLVHAPDGTWIRLLPDKYSIFIDLTFAELKVTVVVLPPHDDDPPILREEVTVFEPQDDVI